jgi:hypothetical protein
MTYVFTQKRESWQAALCLTETEQKAACQREKAQ